MSFHGIAVPFPLRLAASPRASSVRSLDRRSRISLAAFSDDTFLGAVRAAGEAAIRALTGVALALAVLTIGPRVLPYQVLPVLTGSMEPAIPTGALAVVTPVSASDVAVGDVITFNHPFHAGSYVTHRVVAILEDASGRTFVTRGDANASPDPWRISGAGGGWRVAFAVPQLGTALIALGASPVRALADVSVVALAVFTLRRVWRRRPARAPAPVAARAA